MYRAVPVADFERHLRIEVEVLTEFVDDGGNLQTTEDRHKISVMGRSNYAMIIDGECADEYVRYLKLVENVDNSRCYFLDPHPHCSSRRCNSSRAAKR